MGPKKPPHFFSEVGVVEVASMLAPAAAAAAAQEAAAVAAAAVVVTCAATAGALSSKESPVAGAKFPREFPEVLLAPSLPRLRSEAKSLDPPTAP